MVVKRIKNALDAANAAANPKPIAAFKPKPVDRRPNTYPKQSTWALIHLGQDSQLEQHLQDHEARCIAGSHRCLVISNHFPPSALIKPDILFEFAPISARSAHDLDPEAATVYFFERLTHIVNFWSVTRCMWTGERGQEMRTLSAQYSNRLKELG